MEPPITASIKPTIRNAEAKLKFISYPDYFLIYTDSAGVPQKGLCRRQVAQQTQKNDFIVFQDPCVAVWNNDIFRAAMDAPAIV